ncbi:MAG: DUF1080 domain-containing protein [Candidatus Brocadiia bacterium]|nr:MAG: DUF1080 domain-containing protein [Candidatus Brocadiia bacterium]
MTSRPKGCFHVQCGVLGIFNRRTIKRKGLKMNRFKTIRICLILGLLFLSAFCHNVAHGQTSQVSHGGRVMLTGSDFSAWKEGIGTWQQVKEAFIDPMNQKGLASRPGSGVIVNGPKGNTGSLLTKDNFGDIRAHIEFMLPKGSNSGIYFMGRYELQVYDSWQVESEYPGIECGGIYPRWDPQRNPKNYEGYSPKVNASLAPGQWQSFDIVFRAPRFDGSGNKIVNAAFVKVVHNGRLIHENVEMTGPTRGSKYTDEKHAGPLMIQGDHGPVAYRSVWIEPLGLTNQFFAMDTSTKDKDHQTTEAQSQMLKELGYDGFAYSGFNNIENVLEELDRNDLKLFAIYINVLIDPPAGKDRYKPEMKDSIKKLKGRDIILWLTVNSTKYPCSSPDGDPCAVAVIREIADMAEQSGLRVALYPHHKSWIERVEDAVRVAKKVNRPNVGATFNLCHWLRIDEEKSLEIRLNEAMPYLFVVTINGADSGGKDWKSLIQTLDKGSFDMCGFLKTLNRLNYTGPIGLQGYGIGGDAYENLKNSMNAWRRFVEICR